MLESPCDPLSEISVMKIAYHWQEWGNTSLLHLEAIRTELNECNMSSLYEIPWPVQASVKSQSGLLT